jgi:hypothetical protein
MDNSKFYRNMMVSGALIVIALAINRAMTPEEVTDIMKQVSELK